MSQNASFGTNTEGELLRGMDAAYVRGRHGLKHRALHQSGFLVCALHSGYLRRRPISAAESRSTHIEC